MAIKGSWYERDSRFIAAHHQPALLLDLALARDLDSHRLLRGSGLEHLARIRAICQPELGWLDARWHAETDRYTALWNNHYSLPPAAGAPGSTHDT